MGTFQFVAAKEDIATLKTLVDYAIERHYPELIQAQNKAIALFKAVMKRQIKLIVNWMRVSFVHGVMNTDNFTISGETIDYGPCAFLDEYHPGKVFSSIDQNGRYAFGNQPSIASWNLASLAGCLIAFIDKDSDKANELATAVLDNFSIETNQRILDLMCKKIGISGSKEENHSILRRLLKIMMENQADYTLTFRNISKVLVENSDEFFQLFKDKNEIHQWLKDWRAIVNSENSDLMSLEKNLNEINPIYIPRNHQVQLAIDKAYENDFSKMLEMIDVVKRPFEEKLQYSSYAEAPLDEQKVQRTFCGT